MYSVVIHIPTGNPLAHVSNERSKTRLLQDILAGGQYPQHDLQVKVMTRNEYETLFFNKKLKPAREARNASRRQFESDRRDAMTRMRTKLNLSASDMSDLEMILGRRRG